MLAQEKKHLIDLLDKIPDKRHKKVLLGEGRVNHKKASRCDEVLELRILGDATIIHKLAHIAVEVGAMLVEESNVGASSAEKVEEEFSDNPIGTILQGVRFREGMTQVELSTRTGIPQRHISEMENGKRPIGKGSAKKLADAMGVSYRIFL